MAATTTYSNFGANTEGIEVTKAFKDAVFGKTIMITGVNKGGVGFSTAHALASQSPKNIIIAGRNSAKLQECIQALERDYANVAYRPFVVDLSSQKAVRKAASELLSWSDLPTIDILINNAAVMGLQERTLNEDGIEMHFGTNVIGHWLLTCLIMPKIFAAAKQNARGATRIVNVSSMSPQVSSIRWSDMNFDKKNRDLPQAEQPAYEWMTSWGYKDVPNQAYIPLDGYDRSKVGNVLFGIGLNKRLFQRYGVFSTTVHPGVISTELGRNFDEKTIAAAMELARSGAGGITTKSFGAGSSTTLVAALDPKLADIVGESKDGKENWGAYLIDCQISGSANPLAVSSNEAEKLWAHCQSKTAEGFDW